jgi:hypothetical protein
MDVKLAASGVRLADLQAVWPLKGSLRFLRDADGSPAAWTGDLAISEIRLPVTGLALPLDIDAATLRFKGADFAVAVSKGRYDEVPFSATYSAHRLSLTVPKAFLGQVESALAPSLRRRQGFLARTLRLSASPVPEWLRTRRLDATVHVGTLEAGDFTLDNFRAQLKWIGPRFEIREFSGTVSNAPVTGQLTASLDTPEPAWHGHVVLERYPWRDGRLDAEAAVGSLGLGADFMAALQLDGTYHLRDDSGCFTMTSTPEGRLTLELSSPQRTVRLASADLAAR